MYLYCRSSVDIAYEVLQNKTISTNPLNLARNINNARSGLIPKHPMVVDFEFHINSIPQHFLVQDIKVIIMIKTYIGYITIFICIAI